MKVQIWMISGLSTRNRGFNVDEPLNRAASWTAWITHPARLKRVVDFRTQEPHPLRRRFSGSFTFKISQTFEIWHFSHPNPSQTNPFCQESVWSLEFCLIRCWGIFITPAGSEWAENWKVVGDNLTFIVRNQRVRFKPRVESIKRWTDGSRCKAGVTPTKICFF